MIGESKIRFDEYLKGEGAATLVFTAFAALLLSLLFVARSVAQQQGQQTFPSPEDGVTAFFTATQNEDEEALLRILGPAGKDVVSSGDPVQDMKDRLRFVVKYQEMHRMVKEPDGTRVLYVGAENWPFPIPIVNKNGVWFFDTDAGKGEILARRIGRNELSAIDASRQLVDAEKQYYQKPYNGQPHYAERFVSDKGKHDGLFWSEAGDEYASPIDPLIASAGQDTSTSAQTDDGPIPFNGYYFRILTSQGKAAPGGAKSYLRNGAMASGFAFIAYPAEYRSSGVMTFIVSEKGTVYEKDLGPNTATLAVGITEYNPDSSWHQVD